MNKDSVRLRMQAKRRELFGGERRRAAADVCRRLFDSGILDGAAEVNVYRSFGAELGTDDILAELFARGVRVSVPATVGQEMIAVRVEADTAYAEGAFGTAEPREKIAVDKQSLDVVLVPGLAFDREGFRVGYGKGCYDRFLAATKALRVGLGYDFQVLGEVPREAHDLPLDCIVTDKRILRREA